MKNFFKIIFILSLTIFAVTGCADDSGGNGGGNGEVYTQEFTKLISIGGLSYGETADGKKYAWGNVGELTGAGNRYNIRTPKEVDFTIIYNITSVSTYYILTDTGLYAWGNSDSGQVGNGTTGNVLTPHKVEGIDGNIKEVIATGINVYVLTDTGLYAWGFNWHGEVGNGESGSFNMVATPHKVEGIDGNIKEVITSGWTVYVLTDTGLYAWGYNDSGQVGNGTTDNVLTPYKVAGIDGNIKEVITYGYTVYVLTDTGLYAWGYNLLGEVGNGTTDNVLTPYKTVDGNIKEFKDLDLNFYAITEDGLYAWGTNSNGQVGNGTTGEVLTPHKVEGVDGNIKDIIADNTVYVLTDTGLYAWGTNSSGEVGNGESGLFAPPHKVEGIDGNIKEVIINGSIARGSTVYVLTDTGLYAWGNNWSGEVGNGTTDNVLTPYKVVDGNVKDFIVVNNDNDETYYVVTDDGLYAWGNNGSGQVGNGTTEDVLTPYKVVSGNVKDFIVVNNDNNETYYVVTDDGLYAWGDNWSGEVGNGTTDNVLTPYKVVDGNVKDFIVVNNDNDETYYVVTDDGLYAWGNNGSGQVGNGTTEDVLTPYKVVSGNVKDFIVVNNDNNETYYVVTDDGLYAWGDNSYGQVGNGTTDNVLTPYKVQIEKQN